jgi:exodeoxyribonuclease VII large subunit
MQAFEARLSDLILDVLAEQRTALDSMRDGMRFFSPARRIQSERQRLDDLAHRAQAGQVHRLALEASQLRGLDKRLEALNPLQVLARGYAVVTRRKDGALVYKVGQARDGIRVRVSDGDFEAEVVNQS